MKKLTSVILAVVMAASAMLAGCGEKMTVLEPNGAGYEVSVPSSWTSYLSGKDKSSFFAYYSKDDPASVTVNVYGVDTGEFPTVAAWWEMSAEKLSLVFGDVGDVAVSNVTVSGMAALRAEFSATVSAASAESETEETSSEASSNENGASYRYRFVHLIVMKDARVYDLVCTSLEENFEEHSSDFDSVMKSFRLTETSVSAQVPDTDGAPDGMQNGTTVNTQYTVCVPISWAIDENDGSFEAHANDGTSVNIISWETESDLTLDGWWKSYLGEISTVVKNVTVISEEEVTVSGTRAVLHRFTGEYNGSVYEFEQYALGKGYMLHVITYSTAEELADAHRGELDAIIDSFKLK